MRIIKIIVAISASIAPNAKDALADMSVHRIPAVMLDVKSPMPLIVLRIPKPVPLLFSSSSSAAHDLSVASMAPVSTPAKRKRKAYIQMFGGEKMKPMQYMLKIR